MVKRAIIVTGGSGPTPPVAYQRQAGDLVICADSGWELARRLSLDVDLWVGDFDSTPSRDPISSPSLIIKRSPRDKDQSDTELALIEAKAAGFEEWILLGGGGRRIDHLLATYALFSRYGAPLIWQTGHETMYLVTGTKTFTALEKDQTVSFLPSIMGEATTVTARQLVWPLVEAVISITSISLSNRTTGTTLRVDVEHGSGVLVSFPVADRHR